MSDKNPRVHDDQRVADVYDLITEQYISTEYPECGDICHEIIEWMRVNTHLTFAELTNFPRGLPWIIEIMKHIILVVQNLHIMF